MIVFSGVLAREGLGDTCPPGKSFLGEPKQHLGARYEAGIAVEILSFTCFSPINLTKNEGFKV